MICMLPTSSITNGGSSHLSLLAISGRGNTHFAFKCFAKSCFRIIAELPGNPIHADLVFEQTGCHVHAPAREIFHGRLTDKLSKASGECRAREGHRLCQFLNLPAMF